MLGVQELEDVMAQLARQDLTTPAKPTRARSRLVVYGGSNKGQEHSSTDYVAEVTVSKARFKRFAGKGHAIGALLANYADTLARAEREGRVATMTLQVSPDGETQLAEIASNSDALDAALAAAKARGQGKVTDILKGEEMLTGRDFGPLIGASHETVNAKRKRGEVLGLQGATRGVKYPRWQLTDAGLPLPGLAALFETLGAQPWTVYRFLRTAHAELGGRTALDALKAGQVEAALGAARNQNAGVFG
jgi:hypothetical protein